MPLSALPDKLNPKKNPSAWKGTDNDSWIKRFLLPFQVFGSRAKESWARWRQQPIVLFAIARGTLRIETIDGTMRGPYDFATVKKPRQVLVMADFGINDQPAFLSRIQPFCRWHFAIHWPLLITWSVFWKEKDVEQFDAHNYKKRTIKELFCGYLGAKYDSVDQYFKISVSAGGSWE